MPCIQEGFIVWQHMTDCTLSGCDSPLHVARSSWRGVLFIPHIAPGALFGVWHFLPLQTIAPFCGLLVTASFYAWLSLAPKYRGQFPFYWGILPLSHSHVLTHSGCI